MPDLDLNVVHYAPFTESDVSRLWRSATGTLAVRINSTWTTLNESPRKWPLDTIEAVYGTDKPMPDSERVLIAKLQEAQQSPAAQLQRVASAELIKQAKDEVIAEVRSGHPFARSARRLLRTAGLILVAFLVAHAALFATGTVVLHGAQWVWLINKHLVLLFPATHDLTADPVKPEAP